MKGWIKDRLQPRVTGWQPNWWKRRGPGGKAGAGGK